jgi:hypothetical protein
MAQKGRKKAPKTILAHMQILVKCFDLVSLPVCPGGVLWTTYVIFLCFFRPRDFDGQFREQPPAPAKRRAREAWPEITKKVPPGLRAFRGTKTCPGTRVDRWLLAHKRPVCVCGQTAAPQTPPVPAKRRAEQALPTKAALLRPACQQQGRGRPLRPPSQRHRGGANSWTAMRRWDAPAPMGPRAGVFLAGLPVPFPFRNGARF